MPLQSICPAVTLENAKEDYKRSARAEQYRVGDEAVYFAAFPGTKYLPFAAIRQAWVQKSSLPLTGCCGKELPVVVLRTRYEGGFYQHFTFEKSETAQRVLDILARRCPGILLDPEPVGRR